MRKKTIIIVCTIAIIASIFAFYYYSSSPDQIISSKCTYKSELSDFTPQVITSTIETVSVFYRDEDNKPKMKTEEVIIAKLDYPRDIKEVTNRVKILMLGGLDKYHKDIQTYLESIIGKDNVILIDISQTSEIRPGYYDSYGALAIEEIRKIISPAKETDITLPVIVILDNDNTLLAVLDWPQSYPTKDEVVAIANMGLGYYGVYIPAYKYNTHIWAPTHLTLLTDEQKQNIQKALEPLYKINIYVR